LLKAWNQLRRGSLMRRHEPGSDDVSDLSLRRARELVVQQYWSLFYIFCGSKWSR
jgi:hypothetical protein